MLSLKLREYAKLLLQNGINLQKDQTLVINVDVENKDFAHIVTDEAYRMGAYEVVINWRSINSTRQRFLHANEEALTRVESWIPEFYKNYSDRNAAFLSLISANPKALVKADPKRISKQNRALNEALEFYHEAIMGSHLTWCVAAVSSLAWANTMKYKGSDQEKVRDLWFDIFRLCRIMDVPQEEYFTNHLKNLKTRTNALNQLNLQALHYTCSNGTNLIIGLPDDHIWQGGNELSTQGIEFNANIPTEEVFTAPHYRHVNGQVYATKPLIYQGNTIKNFHLIIENGDIVECHAEEGQEILEGIINTDEGSHFLGEVALVDHYSPISQSNKLFYETLFDENASCHLAIGASYPTCIKNNQGQDSEALRHRGMNYSMTHVDFMIGHEDMKIIGIKKNGEEVLIMDKGHLCI